MGFPSCMPPSLFKLRRDSSKVGGVTSVCAGRYPAAMNALTCFVAISGKLARVTVQSPVIPSVSNPMDAGAVNDALGPRAV